MSRRPDKMLEPAQQPNPPSSAKRLVGATILLLMYAIALFGDVIVWAIYGIKFVLSPIFHQTEEGLRDLTGISFMGFLIFERGAEHLQRNRWKPFLFGVLMVIVASLPFAKPCALLVRFAMVKGVTSLSQPKITLLIGILLLVFACKCKAMFTLWRLLRSSSGPRETRRIVISK